MNDLRKKYPKHLNDVRFTILDYPGVKGYSLKDINRNLLNQDLYGWMHLGHGGENWTYREGATGLDWYPDNPKGRGTLVLSDEDNSFNHRQGHSPNEFKPNHKLFVVALPVCFAGLKANDWKSSVVSPAGILYATEDTYGRFRYTTPQWKRY